MSLHWLIGSEAKSYQAFQCLLLSAKPAPLIMFGRLSERCEFVEDSLANEVVGWGGGEPEDPIDTFRTLADRLGLRGARVGLETPPYYLHPHQYVRLKDMLGAALVAEPANLIHHLKQVKSPREIALIRESARIADVAMAACIGSVAEGRTELEIAAAVYQSLLSQGSSLPASAMNLVTGERCGFAHGAPTLRRLWRGDPGNVEFGAAYKRYTKTIGRQFNLGPPSQRVRDVFDVVRRVIRCRAWQKSAMWRARPSCRIRQHSVSSRAPGWTGIGCTPPAIPSAPGCHRPGASRTTSTAAVAMCCALA